MRNETISMTKAFAIILMVLAHTFFSDQGDALISMFHMPLFFIMSGYCFKDEYLNNFKGFAWKRIKGAYWPFVKWGLLFLLLHNFFYALNISNGEYTINDILLRGFYIITTMSKAEQLLGGYWFLHAYFISSFIAFATIWVFRRKKNFTLLGGGILLIIACLISYFQVHLPGVGKIEMLGAFFMVFGYVYKDYNIKFEEFPKIAIPIGLLTVIAGARFWRCYMGSVTWDTMVPYCISAIGGTIMVLSICRLLRPLDYLTKALVFVGDRTIDVLTWHFLSFKIVSFLIIIFYELEITRLSEFPVIIDYSVKGWWVIYLLIGVGVSLLIGCMLDFANCKIHDTIKFYKKKA